MKVDIKNSLVAPDNVAEAIDSLESYRRTLEDVVNTGGYTENESSINLSSDKDILVGVNKVAGEIMNESLSHVFVIGIGGSNLGAKAIYDALFGHFDIYRPGRTPKMYFVDTNDTKTLMETVSLLKSIEKKEELLVNVVTKSGGTTETIMNAEIIISALKEKFGDDAYERIVVTSNKDSDLTKEAKKLNIKTLEIPEKVGGRFSVLSPVGIFPLLCAGVDVEALLHGAKNMRDKCISDDLHKNVAIQSAAVLYLLRKKGKTIHTNFVFHPELKPLSDWYRQLLAESIGKKENNKGDVIQIGITPETAVGSTDLHSMAQLYLGGPRDKLTTFVSVHALGGIASVSTPRVFPGLVKSIEDKSAEEVMDAILRGTKEAYRKAELPFMEVELEDVSPYELGAYMQFKMCEIMYLGKLLNINAFNQPSVEDYKVETKNILEGK